MPEFPRPSAAVWQGWLLFLAVLAVGAALRLVELENRPMHADEAVHALKFGELLEQGRYVYDPHEYHGPILNYLTLPLARAAGRQQLAEVSEAELRSVPALSGILLIALVWLLRPQLGRPAALVAAALTAVSPAMVFYSRYYIQEMLLATFSLAAIVVLWRAVAAIQGPDPEDRSPDASPASGQPAQGGGRDIHRNVILPVGLGVCLGLMHASKETCVIAYLAMAIAACAALGGLVRRASPKSLLRFCLVTLAAAALVSALLYSSFLQNPGGIGDSFGTYRQYVQRAAGEGSAGPHVYPWYQYLRWLFWQPVWGAAGGTEAAIAVLAVPGLIAAVAGRGMDRRQVPWARFVAIYTLVMWLTYCGLPYKTPWCAVGPLHGLILLAGIGAAVLLELAPRGAGRLTVSLLVTAAVAHLGWQAYTASFIALDAPGNPYVYAHPRRDIELLAQQIQQVADGHPDGRRMHIQVICPQGDYWPLPWYLRQFPRVGWFADQPSGPPAPLIVSWPRWEPQILDYLYVRQPPGQRPLYVALTEQQPRYELRPGVPLSIFVQLAVLRSTEPDG